MDTGQKYIASVNLAGVPTLNIANKNMLAVSPRKQTLDLGFDSLNRRRHEGHGDILN